MTTETRPFVDGFGRPVTYLRLSVTDRCDLRCTYCMPQHMIFTPRKSLLGVAELDRIAEAFVAGGVRKIRLTGGEPLVRKDLPELLRGLARHLAAGRLDEITVSTNGSQLARLAETLADCGVRRVNVSLDTLDPDQYREITRGGELSDVLEGIEAARRAGLSIRINSVALRGVIEEQFEPLLRYAHSNDMAMALIETMPLGETGTSRADQYLSLTEFRKQLSDTWSLSALERNTGGPAQYVEVKQTGGSTLSGERAFALHDTYGFPIDLTLEMAAEAGLSVDEDGFRSLMAEQRKRAKDDAQARKLADMFRQNIEKFGAAVSPAIRAAGPRG